MSHILDTQRPKYTIIRGKFYYLNIRVPKVHQQVHGQVIRAKLSNGHCQTKPNTSQSATITQNARLYLAETTRLFTQLWASFQSGEADGGVV